MIEALVQARGYEVTAVASGTKAIDVACTHPPDIVLLDLNLPKRDGLEVLEQIKSNFELRNIPVVVLTASDDAADKAKCEQFQVESFINKPVNLTKFLTVIKQLKRYLLEDVILPAIE